MNCRICEIEITKNILLEDIPISISELYDMKNQTLKTSDSKIYMCTNCGHNQIENLNELNYYEDYLMQVSHSNKINVLQDQQIQKLLSYTKKTQSLIEIGCGDGNFLSKTTKYFDYSVGYEPSLNFYNLCKQKNLEVINSYFPSIDIKNKLFDVFVSRQVFEHLENPKEILKNIYSALHERGVGLIEVPNGRKIFNDGRYYEIISDHLNYFTEKSLLRLVSDAGFEVINLKEDFGGDYLVVYVRKNSIDNTNLGKEKEKDVKFLKELNNFKKIVVWGAGAKAFNFISLVSNENTIYAYIDSDKYKVGKYLPRASKPIELPSNNILDADVVVIFAVSYEDEILKYLQDIGYKNSVMLFSNHTIANIGWTPSIGIKEGFNRIVKSFL